MIINRRTFIVKKGEMQKAVEILKTAVAKLEQNLTRRIYTPVLGPFDIVVLEGEYEDLNAYQQDMNRFVEAEWHDSFMQDWHSVIEVGGSNEIWSVESV